MPLKVFTFTMGDDATEMYALWIAANPTIKIQTKHLCTHTNVVGNEGRLRSFERLYVFYETPNDVEYSRNRALIEQDAQLDMLKDVAKSLLKDEYYKKLTNKTQRHLYLLDCKNIPSNDADIVIELLKPEMRGLLNGDLP